MKERICLQYFRQKNLFCVLNRTFCKVLGGKYNQNYTLFFLLNYVRLLNGHKKADCTIITYVCSLLLKNVRQMCEIIVSTIPQFASGIGF